MQFGPLDTSQSALSKYGFRSGLLMIFELFNLGTNVVESVSYLGSLVYHLGPELDLFYTEPFFSFQALVKNRHI